MSEAHEHSKKETPSELGETIAFLRTKKNWIIYLILGFIMLGSYLIRLKGLPNLVDRATNTYIPLGVDPFVFLRYARELLANGNLAAVDMLRYFPDGYTQIGEFSLLTHFIVSLYKFLHVFNPTVTLEYVHILYPAIVFPFTLLFFFFLTRKLFNAKVGLLATAYLAVSPIILERTLAGFSDKESLAFFLLILAFYFYISALKTSNQPRSIVLGLLAGIVTGLMGLTWGGYQFVLLIFALLTLIQLIMDNLPLKDLSVYAAWSVVTYFILTIFSGKFGFFNFFIIHIHSLTYLVLIAGILTHLLKKYNPLHIKEKLHHKLPLGLFTFLITSLLCLIGILLVGFDFFVYVIRDQLTTLISPYSATRWGITVSESKQPFLKEIIHRFGLLFFVLLLTGAIVLFYNLVKHLKKYRTKLTFSFSLFVLLFFFSRYSRESLLNGANTLSIFLYLGSLLCFILGLSIFFIYLYRKRPEDYQMLLQFDKFYLFVLIWFIIKFVAARSAIRLLIVFSLPTAIIVACLLVTSFEYALKQKRKTIKYLGIFAILLAILSPITPGTLAYHASSSLERSENYKPPYTIQWQVAMDWVKKNTPEDAVFMHWWDYGYWVQTGGERATVSDGGNVGGAAVNYFTARNVLTSPNEEDALAFMKAKQADHLLFISDDVQKYRVFATIGSDLEMDRETQIDFFHLNPAKTQEVRENTIYTYEGTARPLYSDFVYQDTFFTKLNTGVIGFSVPISSSEDGELIISRPSVHLASNNKEHVVPVNCLVFEGHKAIFEADGLDACLVVIPHDQNGLIDPKGSLIYVPPKAKDSLLARLYIYEEELANFELVYSDAVKVPLTFYNGFFAGPLKIWEVTLPENIEVDPMLNEKDLPDFNLYYTAN